MANENSDINAESELKDLIAIDFREANLWFDNLREDAIAEMEKTCQQ